MRVLSQVFWRSDKLIFFFLFFFLKVQAESLLLQKRNGSLQRVPMSVTAIQSAIQRFVPEAAS